MGIDKTREKIMSVANRLFGRFGFQKTSMDEIAKIARKAKGSLYYHFSSKEELFREVVRKEIEEIKTKLMAVVSNSEYSAEGKLKKYLLTRMAVMQDAVNYNETIYPADIDHFEFMDDIKGDFDAWEKERFSSIIDVGREREEFNLELETEVLSEMFIMILKGLEIPFYVQGRYEQYLPHFDGMAKILLKGMK
jgi:AcrR family transcriptional regulator